MPPMTPPTIAPVLFAEEPPLTVLPLLTLVSFAGAAVIEGVVPEDASVDLGGDGDAVGVVGEDDWFVVDVVFEVGLVGVELAVGVMR